MEWDLQPSEESQTLLAEAIAVARVATMRSSDMLDEIEVFMTLSSLLDQHLRAPLARRLPGRPERR